MDLRTEAIGLALTTLLCGVSTASFGCPVPDGWQSMVADGDNQGVAAVELLADAIVLAEPFQISIMACRVDMPPPDRIVFDATMPAHRHGMNYQPRIMDVGDGVYQIDGLLFHMPGTWQISLSAFWGDSADHFIFDVPLR